MFMLDFLKTEHTKKVFCFVSALVRERDELLALLDVRDKMKYERSKSQSSEEDYGTYSCAEVCIEWLVVWAV